jgi:hypothetical protein
MCALNCEKKINYRNILTLSRINAGEGAGEDEDIWN